MLTETAGAKQLVVGLCDLAGAAGVRRGMTLAEARALCMDLVDVPHEPQRDARAMEALARWMMLRFSPVVAMELPDALFLEVGGCARLFGGLDRLIRLVSATFEKMRITAAMAIAPAPGAAWALAWAHAPGECRLVSDQSPAALLGPLPVRALRIKPAVAAALHRVGVERIEQLLRLPRSTLPARFGDDLLRRIDQALGDAPEPLAALRPRVPIQAELEFEAGVDSLETIWQAFKQLIGTIAEQLLCCGCGARQMKLRLRRAYGSPIEKTIALSRPCRDAVNLFNLLRCALETLGSDQGIVAVGLIVLVSEPLTQEQIPLLGREQHQGQAELDHLIERLTARMGDRAVTRARLVESYVPERASLAVHAMANVSSRSETARLLPPAPRPLHLLDRPVEIGVMVLPSEDREGKPISFTHRGKVHRLAVAAGPERIAGRWWDGQNKTRDYFDVEDEEGGRFWVFRVLQTWKWYLHGRFE